MKGLVRTSCDNIKSSAMNCWPKQGSKMEDKGIAIINKLCSIMPKKNTGVTKEKTSKIVKKISASECGTGVLCTTRSGKQYQISQNPEKKKHTLWRIVDGGYEKIATGDSPYDLYPLIDWDK